MSFPKVRTPSQFAASPTGTDSLLVPTKISPDTFQSFLQTSWRTAFHTVQNPLNVTERRVSPFILLDRRKHIPAPIHRFLVDDADGKPVWMLVFKGATQSQIWIGVEHMTEVHIVPHSYEVGRFIHAEGTRYEVVIDACINLRLNGAPRYAQNFDVFGDHPHWPRSSLDHPAAASYRVKFTSELVDIIQKTKSLPALTSDPAESIEDDLPLLALHAHDFDTQNAFLTEIVSAALELSSAESGIELPEKGIRVSVTKCALRADGTITPLRLAHRGQAPYNHKADVDRLLEGASQAISAAIPRLIKNKQLINILGFSSADLSGFEVRLMPGRTAHQRVDAARHLMPHH